MEKQTFKVFNEHARILIYFSEKMGGADIEEAIQEMYILYKENKAHEWPSPFLREHLIDVTRDTHDFWLDERGGWLMELASVVGRF